MYRKEILNGINYLKSIQNKDGGIPGIKETGASACWTTAEALEAVLLSPYISMEHYNFVFKMLEFILKNQMNEPDNKYHDGAWPEYNSMHIAQTMTTGHAISALKLAEHIIVDDDDLRHKIKESINKGLGYLNKFQNSDGGWGIEPEGGKDENTSRAFGTTFVLRGYIQNGYTAKNSTVVRSACNYLLSLRDPKTGGFSKDSQSPPDVCYTARIISILIKAQAYTRHDPIIKKALKFIYRDQPLKELFKIKHDQYISSNSSGMVIFHSNTPVDVMEALCLCKDNSRKVQCLLNWILRTQEDKGGWYLGGSRDPQINEGGVISWTTNEAIYALICANQTYYNGDYRFFQKKNRFAKKLFFTFLTLSFILLFTPSVLPTNNFLMVFWANLSMLLKTILSVSVLGTLLLNLFSSTIYDWIKKIFKGGDNK